MFQIESYWKQTRLIAVAALALSGTVISSFAQTVLVERSFTNIDLAIPDNNPSGIVDVRTVIGSPEGSVILDVNVAMKIVGPAARNGDLYATLEHQNGFSILLNRVGRTTNNIVGYEDSGLDVLLDDESENGDIHFYRTVLFGNDETPVGQALASYWAGPWAPDGRNIDPAKVDELSTRDATLSSLRGLPSDGQWRLFIADVAPGGVSELKEWSLQILTTTNFDAMKLDFEDATLRAEAEARRFDTPITVKGSVTVAGKADTTLAGNVSGPGELVKTGGGQLVLSGVNTFSGGIVIEDGALVLGGDRATGTGPIRMKGGTIQTSGGARRVDNAVSFSGKLSLQGDGKLDLAGAVTVDGSSTLSVDNDTTISGDIEESSPGAGFIKMGDGKLTLTGVNTFSGGLSLDEGTLVLGNDRALGTGTLSLKGGRVESTGGDRVISNKLQLAGDVAFGGSNGLTLTGDAALDGLITLGIETTTTFAGTIKEETPGSGFVKKGGGTLILDGANTISGGVSLDEGTLLVNNTSGSGTGSGTVSVSGKSTLGGKGTISGKVALGSGSRVAPGSSPGTLTTGDETWEGGAGFVWEINDAAGTEGVDPGWDALKINGRIQINATAANPFIIQVTSLGLDNKPGQAVHFDSSKQYLWKVAQTTGGISGFDTNSCKIDASRFANALNGGSLRLEMQGNDLMLVFQGVKLLQITSVKMVNSSLQISLEGGAGQTYRIESTDALSPANWVPAGNVTADNSGFGQVSIPLTPSLSMKFYRVTAP